MNNKMVSIIIPLYNSEDFILQCIDSCLRQTYEAIEIIVVDDGSTDGGLNMVSRIAKKEEKVRLIHTENKGVSSARNVGLKAANGAYICFVDADDSISEEFVETLVGHMDKFDADFCFSKNVWAGNTKKIAPPKVISRTEAEVLLLGPNVKVGCWNKMYRADLIRGMSFCEDLFYGEGLYFINQAAHYSKKIVLCEEGLYHYEKNNPESATTLFKTEKMVNGEEALRRIKNLIKNDGKKVNRVWSQHYCRFCLAAMNGILNMGGHNNKTDYKIWHNRMKKEILPALISDGCGLRWKIKLIAAFVSPKLYNRISKR